MAESSPQAICMRNFFGEAWKPATASSSLNSKGFTFRTRQPSPCQTDMPKGPKGQIPSLTPAPTPTDFELLRKLRAKGPGSEGHRHCPGAAKPRAMPRMPGRHGAHKPEKKGPQLACPVEFRSHCSKIMTRVYQIHTNTPGAQEGGIGSPSREVAERALPSQGLRRT